LVLLTIRKWGTFKENNILSVNVHYVETLAGPKSYSFRAF
jgi:hypothetical protein